MQYRANTAIILGNLFKNSGGVIYLQYSIIKLLSPGNLYGGNVILAPLNITNN